MSDSTKVAARDSRPRVEVKGDRLIIDLPIREPRLSNGGKTMLVASYQAKDAVEVLGESCTIGVNCYFKPAA